MIIVGGTTAKTGEAPWQVLIENMNNAEICGGAIVNELFVLTAAHCTELFRQNGNGKFTYPANILSEYETLLLSEIIFGPKVSPVKVRVKN
jgi:hypothetical protein